MHHPAHLQKAVLQEAPVIRHELVPIADLASLGNEGASCPHNALPFRVMRAIPSGVDIRAVGRLQHLWEGHPHKLPKEHVKHSTFPTNAKASVGAFLLFNQCLSWIRSPSIARLL